ncbi:STM4015 family protein [Spirillospora sp. NPDC047279]|uniref:STM4015 family protein n=1 Tax=Spirillospora sp. NPDC047279 TaxID=3155478 RepID=UPI0033F27B79
MSFDDHLEEFDGLRVVTFAPDTGDPLPEEDEVAWAVRGDWGGPDYPEVFERFVDAVDTTRVTSLVVGFWGAEEPAAAKALIAHADRFPRLRALFLGDIVDEEYHVSWISQGDVTPVLQAFPGLERFEARGGLELSPFASGSLEVLRLEGSGLSGATVRAVAACDLPALRHLELWLGGRVYGGSAEIGDVAPLLAGERLPALRHLGLRNSDMQDEIAAMVAAAPVVAGLESLSLSLGTLTDAGAEALLIGQPLTHLRGLDLHHAYLSETMAERLRSALAGVDLDLTDAVREGIWDEWSAGFYVAVTE